MTTVQTAIPLADAPRTIEGLTTLPTFQLKHIAREMGLDKDKQQWGALIGAPKNDQVSMVLEALIAHDKAKGGAATTAPATTRQPDHAPATNGAGTATAGETNGATNGATPGKRGKREPVHAAPSGTNGATNGAASKPGELVTTGPTGGDILAVREQIRQAQEAITIATAANAANIKEVKGLVDELGTAVQGLTKLLMAISEVQFGDRQAALTAAFDDETGVKEIITNSSGKA